jgi:hypothetical protein
MDFQGEFYENMLIRFNLHLAVTFCFLTCISTLMSVGFPAVYIRCVCYALVTHTSRKNKLGRVFDSRVLKVEIWGSR